MKNEQDCSQGERGKFYRPKLRLNLPIYLEEEVLAYMLERAHAQGGEVGRLVNEILKKEIDRIESVK